MLKQIFVLTAVLSILPFCPVRASSGSPLIVAPAEKRAKLPNALEKKGLTLGMTFKDLSRKRPGIKLYGTETFRKVYFESDFSEDIANLVYYVTDDKDGTDRVYEFIIGLKEGVSPAELGEKTWGKTNHLRDGKGEWRFPGSETGLPGEMAAWVFQNKLVVAFAMPESEWESGFSE